MFVLSGRRGGRAGSASIGGRGVVGEGSSDMVFVCCLFDFVCGVMKIFVVGMVVAVLDLAVVFSFLCSLN